MKKKPHHEEIYRSLLKTVTYRLLIIGSIFIVTILITHKVNDALQVTGVTAITGTIIYYIHERVWAHIAWGRTKK